jgi:hypothetical protein
MLERLEEPAREQRSDAAPGKLLESIAVFCYAFCIYEKAASLKESKFHLLLTHKQVHTHTHTHA